MLKPAAFRLTAEDTNHLTIIAGVLNQQRPDAAAPWRASWRASNVSFTDCIRVSLRVAAGAARRGELRQDGR